MTTTVTQEQIIEAMKKVSSGRDECERRQEAIRFLNAIHPLAAVMPREPTEKMIRIYEWRNLGVLREVIAAGDLTLRLGFLEIVT